MPVPAKDRPKTQEPAVRLFPEEDSGIVTQDTIVVARKPEVKQPLGNVPEEKIMQERKETLRQEDMLKKETDWEHEDFQGDYRKDW